MASRNYQVCIKRTDAAGYTVKSMNIYREAATPEQARQRAQDDISAVNAANTMAVLGVRVAPFAGGDGRWLA
jgi:hypothetical protein